MSNPAERIIPMDSFDDGSKQRAHIRELNKQISDLQSQLTYERQRREAAERVIGDEIMGPETYEKGMNNLQVWQELVNQQPKP